MELGHHPLDLPAVEHPHQRRLNDVIKVVPQRNLVAPHRLSQAVQVPPAHPGAEVTAVLRLALGDSEDIGVKNLDGDVQQGGVLLDLRPVHRVIPRVHDQVFRLKRHLADPL